MVFPSMKSGYVPVSSVNLAVLEICQYISRLSRKELERHLICWLQWSITTYLTPATYNTTSQHHCLEIFNKRKTFSYYYNNSLNPNITLLWQRISLFLTWWTSVQFKTDYENMNIIRHCNTPDFHHLNK